MEASLSSASLFSASSAFSGKRIPELDGVRGLAITFVLLFHYVSTSISTPRVLYYALLPTRQMWSGVDLFFVLSGFLIGGILLDCRDSPSYYSTFYARRIHRIFPLYYLMVGGLILGGSLFPNVSMFHGTIPWWTFLLFAQNLTGDFFTHAPLWIGVSWSLAVEEQFYLVLPVVVRICSRRTLVPLVIACILGAPLLRSLLVMRGVAWDQFYALLPCRADALAFGVGAALIVRSERATAWVRENSKPLYACFLLLYAALPGLLKWPSYTYLNTVSLTFFDAMYFLLILLLLVAPLPFMKTFFRLSLLRWLGTISYCVYLIHQPVREGISMLFGHGADDGATGPVTLIVTLAALAATLLIAQVSWLVLEKPLIKRAHLRYGYEQSQSVSGT